MIINNEFIQQHDRLVRVIVNQFKVANVDPEDLMQEGRIGLIEAAKRFDPNRGIQFSSYASWWIRKYITMALQEYGNIIHVPHQNTTAISVCITESIQKIVKVEDEEALTYEDILTDGSTVETEYIEKEHFCSMRQECQKRIARLKPKEQIVIRGLYGFEGKRKSWKTLAKELGTTPNRIAKIHTRALERL